MSQPVHPVATTATPSASVTSAPSRSAVPAPAAPDRPRPAVRLRVPTHEDAYHWHRVFDHPEVMEFHAGASAEVSVYEELTARQRRHHAELGFCLWTMVAPDGPDGPVTGEVIGFTGAQPWPHAWGPVGEVEIGWRLGRDHWGRGYATEAALAGLDEVRATGVRHVVAMVDARNARSLAVTERLGMERVETFATPSGRRGHCFRLEL